MKESHLRSSNTSWSVVMSFNLSRINASGSSGQLIANALTMAYKESCCQVSPYVR